MNTYVELLSNLIQIFVLVYFVTKAFGFKKNSKLFQLGFVLTWIIGFIETSFINQIVVYDGFLSAIVIVTLFFYARLCLKGNLFQQIFVAVFSMTIIFTIGSAILFVFSYVSKTSTELLISNFTSARILIIITGRSLEWLVFKFILRINSEYTLSLKEWFLFTSMPLLTWVAVTLMTQGSMKMNYIQSYMFYIALIMIAINIVIFFFMYKIKQDTETKLEFELLKMQYNNMKQMEINMKALYDSTYSVKHDMEKHLLVLKTLAQKDQCSQIDDYIQKIFDRDLNSIQRIIFTDNDVFNAVINTKLELCRQKNIFPGLSVSNEAVSYIKNSDIAVLFGNLFDNAIEACENTDEKIMFLSIRSQGEYVSVYMENSYNNVHSNIDLKTSKTDTLKHGFGVKNIRRIVENNEGMIQYFTNDSSMFCCDILLKKR